MHARIVLVVLHYHAYVTKFVYLDKEESYKNFTKIFVILRITKIGASVVEWSDHLPLTSEVLSSIPSKVHLNVDSNPVLM